MKYQAGDTVLLLHSNEEGKVVNIINDETVMVDVNGVRFPVYVDQIDFPYFKRFSEKRIVPEKPDKNYSVSAGIEKTIAKYKVDEGTWLSFLPVFNKDIFDDDVIETFKIYLVNHTGESFDFHYQIKFSGTPDFEVKDVVLPFTDFYLHDIPFEEMNDSPKFEFDFSLTHPNKKKAPHFETTFKIKAKQLFQKIEAMRLKKELTFSFNLFENYPDKAEEITAEYHNSYGRIYDASRIKLNLESPRSVVDLHIEKLTDNWKGLSNFEILTIQLNYFEKYYNLAVAHRQPNFIVVHGIGTGKLRNEIHEILKAKKEVKSFANQYHNNFGFGATEIFFQY
jgi:hypothetical protein